MIFIAKILVPLVDGFDDIEALTTVNILRRAGVDVVTVGAIGNIVTSKSNIKVHADERLIDLNDFSKFDGIVVPGCMEAVETLMRNQKFMKVVDAFGRGGRLLGGICAAPLIFSKLGFLNDRRATIRTGLEKNLDKPRSENVIADGNIITASGKQHAVEFAFKIVEQLLGKQKAQVLRQQMA